eukprot:8421763-Alexandrium_andersonii.AAC.2
MRELKKDSKTLKDYKAANTDSERQQFRLDWAARAPLGGQGFGTEGGEWEGGGVEAGVINQR